MLKYSYIWQKCHGALSSMVTNPHSLRQRVTVAWVHHLSHLDNQDWSKSLQPKYDALRERVVRPVPEATDGYIAANVAAMDDEELYEYAAKLFELCYAGIELRIKERS